MLSEQDIIQLKQRGVKEQTFVQYIEQLQKGSLPAILVAPATHGKGIMVTTEKTRQYYMNIFDDYSRDREIVKFVPASGAASRMFKDLFACLEYLENSHEANPDIPEKFSKVREAIDRLYELALFPDLETYFEERQMRLPELLHQKQYKIIIRAILNADGLNYGALPKALLNFHNYGTFQRKAIDEHLVEGALYAQNESGKINIHFTISHEHEQLLKAHLQKVQPLYEQKFGLRYNITWSFQHPSTDTPAIDEHGNMVREHDGSIIFRPAGHGALIKNLNDIDGDLIFIKNIDNITTDKHRATTIEFKKVLAGILIEKEISINGNLSILMDDGCSRQDIIDIAQFVKDDLLISLPSDFKELDIDKQRRMLINKLNCPIRVCGMVKNEGEPGGGPFFVQNSKGIVSLQIVEGAQINMNDPEQVSILNQSTHFNPVDIVAGTVDFLGRKFDLDDFIDKSTYMISEKSKDGKPLKALELPGLWNGAMAGWLTYFVEVPLDTFSPVKEINDLLRPQHQV